MWVWIRECMAVHTSYLKDVLLTWVQQSDSSAKGRKASCEHTLLCVSASSSNVILSGWKRAENINALGFPPALVSPFSWGSLRSLGFALGDAFLAVRDMGADSVLRPVNSLFRNKGKKDRREIRTEGENCPVEISVTLHTYVRCSYMLHLRLCILSFVWRRFFISVECLVRYF